MIPPPMQNAPRWMLWRAIPHTDPTKKTRKVPFYCNGTPRNGRLDTPEDRAQLVALPDAVRVLQAGGYAGLGFALGPDGTGGHWQGVDLDNLPERPDLQSIALPGYTETSPSGRGRHAIGYGRAFTTLGSNTSGIEAYAAGRYFTVTGADPAGELCDLADFVESRLAPMHGTAIRPPAPPLEPAEPIPPEGLNDLYGALLSMPAEDRGLWVSMGLALKSLGDDGRDLWLYWSATCPEKFDEDDALAAWGSFRPERTGYKAVFAEAQRRGWDNPQAGRVAADVFGGAVVPVTPAGPVIPRSLAAARPVEGAVILGLAEQVQLFAGHAYVRSCHKIAGPDGTLSTREQFDSWLGGWQFVMDGTNGKLSNSAWECFTASRLYRFPKVHGLSFRPALPPGAIWEQNGVDVVNTYCPVATPRQAGDPTPFLELLARMLPVQLDRDVLLAYLAACLQYPGVKFKWCVLLQGVEGNGKSFISDCMAEAVGRRYCYKPRAKELTGKFNDWMYGILLACVEDVHAGGKPAEMMESLKPMITEEYQETEGKNKDKQTVNVCFNFVLNSNHKDALLKTTRDRRLAIFYCAQQDEGDLARDCMDGDYFPRLWDWARAGGYAIVNEYLRSYQIPDALNPAGACHRAPPTSSTGEACRASQGPIEQEIREAIEQERVGFRGGWVSTHYLDSLLREVGAERALPRNKRRDVLRGLGYVPHPGLSATDGRVNNPVAPEGAKSRLYVLAECEAAGLVGPAVIASAYTAAQSEATSGENIRSTPMVPSSVVAFPTKKAPTAS
jgi:hypothetical protein